MTIEVLWENRRAFRVFMSCQTQWRMAGFGDVVGLDYSGLWAAMQMLGIKRPKDTFDRVRVIEASALREIARKRDKHKPTR